MRRPDFARRWNCLSHRTTPTGFTLLELLVVTVISTIFVSLLITSMTARRGCTSSLSDGTQSQIIHKGALIWAADNKNLLPTPSQIVAKHGGTAPTDFTLNTTANLFSALVVQNYFTPEICVSPVEVSALVSVADDYDYNQWQPARGLFWDRGFTADLTLASNTSYAHLALCGGRNRLHWKDSANSLSPILGNRGTGGGAFGLGGAISGPDHDRSITLKFHGSGGQWAGNIVFADNHREMVTGFIHSGVTYQPAGASKPRPDNFFAAEFLDAWVNGQARPEASGDAWLGLFVEASADGLSCTPRFDPLNPK